MRTAQWKYFNPAKSLFDLKLNIGKGGFIITNKFKTSNLIITSLFSAILCILSPISIPTPAIPITLSLFIIFVIGATLPAKLGLTSTLLYLLIGSFGLPVFSGFRGGIPVLFGPTGGFLMAYPLMVLITAWGYRLSKSKNRFLPIFFMILALIVCYTIGTLWFILITDSSIHTAITLCVSPFVLLDLLKIAAAFSVSHGLNKQLARAEK